MRPRRKEKRLEPVWNGEAKENVRIPEIVVYFEDKFGGKSFSTNCK